MSDAPARVDGLADADVRRASTDIVLQLVGRVANLALGVAVTLILARSLGDAGFGEWATVLAVVSIVGYLGDLGLDQVAVNQASAEPEREHAWLGGLLSLKVAIAIPATIVTVVVLIAIDSSREMRIAGLLLAGTVLLSGLSATRAVWQLRVRNRVNANFELANGVLWAIAVIVLASQDAGIDAYAAAFVIVTAITAIGQAALSHRHVPIVVRGATKQWPELVKIGIPAAIATLIAVSVGKVDQILVFQIRGASDAGLYGAPYRILDRSQILPAAVMATLFPMIAAAYATDRERAKQIVQLGIDVLATLTIPIVAIVAVERVALTHLILGDQFAASAGTFAVLMGVFGLTAFGYLAGYLVIVQRLQWTYVRIGLIGLTINIVGNLVFVPTYGIIAAAWMTIVTEVFVIGLSLRANLRVLQMRLSMRRLWRVLVCTAIAGLVAYGLREAGLGVVLVCLLASAATAAALMGLRTWTVEELRSVRRRVPPETAPQ